MAVSGSLRKILVYRTATRVYLVARTKDRDKWWVLKFTRDTEPADLEVQADPTVYTEAECKALLCQINGGNLQHGGLKLVCTADAVVGCFRFLEGYYLLLVTKKRYLGTVCGAKVYGIASSALVSLCCADAKESKDEQRYRKLLGGLELAKDFFFSYEYPLWQTVQTNLASRSTPRDAWDPSNMFLWNEFLTRPLRDALGESSWVMPLIHGFWQQRSLNVDGRAVTVTLVARRSKFFAGTRYRKRGINDEGHVANHVEVEQIVGAGFDRHTGFPLVSAMVQVRGSIPLYWEHELGTRKVKPAINLQCYDPLYTSTCLHFQDLAERYGSPIVILNLVKSSEKVERESILRRELSDAIAYCNKKMPEGIRVKDVPWDFKHFAKQRGGDILKDIAPVVTHALNETSIFVCPPAPPSVVASKAALPPDWEPDLQLQHGVLRSNCIDCLDRTNVAQFAFGLSALGRQLHQLEIIEVDAVNSRSSLAAQLMDMYEQMGNGISRQYGGSDAHSTLFQQKRGSWEAATTMRDKLTSIHRYYSNQFTDAERQDAINLFLGHFRPEKGMAAIWELEHDLYLHSSPRRSLLPSIPERPHRFAFARSETTVSAAVTAVSDLGPPAGSGAATAICVDSALSSTMDTAPFVPTSTSSHEEGIWTEGLPQGEGAGHGGMGPALASGVEGQTEAPIITIDPSCQAETAKVDRALGGLPEGQQGVLGGSTDGGAVSKDLHAALAVAEGIPSEKGTTSASEDPLAPATPPPTPVASMSAWPGLDNPHALEARGVTRFRCTDNPAKRMKLESFDRKIGKQPNILQEVRTRADPQKPYLPQWLSSPLGMTTAGSRALPPGRPPIPPIRSPSSIQSSSDSDTSTHGLATPGTADYFSLPSSPTGQSPGGRPHSARSGRGSRTGLAMLSGAPFRPSASGCATPVWPLDARGGLSRASSPPAMAIGRAIHAKLDFYRSMSQPDDDLPLAYPSLAFEHPTGPVPDLGPEHSGVLPGSAADLTLRSEDLPDGVATSARRLSFLSMRDLWKPSAQAQPRQPGTVPLQHRSSSADLGQEMRRTLGANAPSRSMTALDLAGAGPAGQTAEQSSLPSRRSSVSTIIEPAGPGLKLGMAPAQAALWTPGPPSDAVWYQDGRQTQDSYHRFMTAVAAQLQHRQSQLLEEQYVTLCNPTVPISLGIGGFDSGEGAAWRQQEGLVGAKTFGESSLRSLVSAL